MFVTITINLMDKVDKLISIIRQLHEDGMSAGASTTGSTVGAPGFSSAANPKGPTAGYDPVMGMTRRKGIIGKGKYAGARTRWKKPQP
jgi:hypothetical protein